jgi:hypothetical protein
LLVNPTYPALAEPVMRGVQAEARTLGIELHLLHASSDSDLDPALATAARLRVAGLVVGPDTLFNSRIGQLAALSVRHALPTVYQWREFVAAGGLLSYGSSISDSFRLGGVYTGRILKGDKPAGAANDENRAIHQSQDPPSSQCWTFIKVVGHVKSRLDMRASLRKAQTFGNYGCLRNACYITKATSERDGEAAHAG